jgi:hypothetical protein
MIPIRRADPANLRAIVPPLLAETTRQSVSRLDHWLRADGRSNRRFQCDGNVPRNVLDNAGERLHVSHTRVRETADERLDWLQ